MVFYDCDQKMTLNLLKAIITAVEQSDYVVHFTVCEMGGSNYSNYSFDKFVDACRKMYVFADVPHLVKLLRNHFLDHGCHSADGNETMKL